MEVARKMHAVRIHEYGAPDVLKYEEADVPVLAPGEVLVRISYASVNPFDYKVRSGSTQSYLKLKLPAILGIDLAGTVEQVGDKVSRFKKGDRVFGRADFKAGGSYAEYAAVKEDDLAFAPKSISLKEAAALPVVTGTAMTALFDVAKVKKGMRVLITGASGGVGSMAVQLAKSVGAYVIATTSAENMEMLKSLGADEVIDYTKGDFSKEVKEPVDVVFDTVGRDTLSKSYGLVKRGGILVTSAGMPDETLAKKYGITAKGFQARIDHKRYEDIARLVDEGKLRAVIGKEFQLSELKAAHELSESRKARGKIIIKIAK
ncbi:MAG: NADP-dependent oxidoreductase [Candidatus Micrarchaeota archaeon]|nr:NADP-dependent oxidoreductase [Candidatus Micrarchaeota archaeon]